MNSLCQSTNTQIYGYSTVVKEIEHTGQYTLLGSSDVIRGIHKLSPRESAAQRRVCEVHAIGQLTYREDLAECRA